MARIDRSIRSVGGYLIGDSQRDGKDQIISECFRFPHPEHNAVNQKIIDQAMAYAVENGYANIRVEIVTSVAVVIPLGIIGWKEVSRRVKPFDNKVKAIFVNAK